MKAGRAGPPLRRFHFFGWPGILPPRPSTPGRGAGGEGREPEPYSAAQPLTPTPLLTGGGFWSRSDRKTVAGRLNARPGAPRHVVSRSDTRSPAAYPPVARVATRHHA